MQKKSTVVIGLLVLTVAIMLIRMAVVKNTHPKIDEEFAGITLNGEAVNMTEPPYKEGKTVYADLTELAELLGCTVELSKSKSTATVTAAGVRYTLCAGQQSVTVKKSGSLTSVSLSAEPKQTERGLDVPVADIAGLFGYGATEEEHTLCLKS